MTSLEYIAALQDIDTKRREAIRVMNSLAETIWTIRHRPLGMMEILQLSNIHTILELLTQPSVPGVSTSSANEMSTGGNGPVSPAPANQGSIPLRGKRSRTRPTTIAES